VATKIGNITYGLYQAPGGAQPLLYIDATQYFVDFNTENFTLSSQNSSITFYPPSRYSIFSARFQVEVISGAGWFSVSATTTANDTVREEESFNFNFNFLYY
jgi:hypothetical protein